VQADTVQVWHPWQPFDGSDNGLRIS